MRACVFLVGVVLAASGASSTGAAPPPGPSVAGPRQTATQEPTFRFRSPGAARYLCAFDSTRLHACSVPYSQWLAVGGHVLRVQAVARSGRRSRTVSLAVRVVSATGLYTDARVRVGDGAGVPAVDQGDVWVPNTRAGTLSRVDVASKRVVATLKLGSPGSSGSLDSAVVAGGSVWVARDAADEIDRIDPKTNRIAATIKVDSRPGGLAVGGGFVWAFHFQGESVTRIDPATDVKRVFTVPGASGTGIVYSGNAVWLLTAQPSSLVELDPETGAVLARVPIAAPQPPKHGIVDTWWVTEGGGSLWLTNPNDDRVTRVDPAQATVVASIPVPVAIPFGVAFFQGAVWVAGEGKVVRIDPGTNRPSGTVTLTAHSAPVFTQLTAGGTGLWATDYDAGVLYRLHVP